MRAGVRAGVRAAAKGAALTQLHGADAVTEFDGIDGEKADSMAALFAGADVAVVVSPHSGDFAKDARVAAGLLRAAAAAAAGVAPIVLVASWTVKYPKTMPQLSSRFRAKRGAARRAVRRRQRCAVDVRLRRTRCTTPSNSMYDYVKLDARLPQT